MYGFICIYIDLNVYFRVFMNVYDNLVKLDWLMRTPILFIQGVDIINHLGSSTKVSAFAGVETTFFERS